MRQQIILLAFTLVVPLSIRVASNNDGGETPFFFENGLVIVDASIKGKIPLQVVLATGSEYSIIDTELLQEYDLQASYTSDGPVIGRPTDSTYTFVSVSTVRVGGSKSRDLNMRLGSMSTVNKVTGRRIFAALGADFFEGQVIQFDFKRKVLKFLAGPASEEEKGKIADSTAGATVRLRMADKISNPFKKTFVVPFVERVIINGKEVKLLLDTGRATCLALSSSSARKLGFAPPNENDQSRADTADSMQIGEYRLTDVPVMLFPEGSSADKSLRSYGVVAGTIFLQQFLVTFNFDKKLVLLKRG